MIKKILMRVVLPLVIIAGGAAAAYTVFLAAPSSTRGEATAAPISVETVTVQPATRRALVSAQGLVVPALEMNVVPEVSGRIIKRSEALIPGGRLREGDVLLRIDGRDYNLALRQEQSRIRSAELELETERGRQGVARREWELLGSGRPADEAPLALRRPHLVARKAGLDAARSTLDRARINLSRTVIKAPWNAVVAEANADVGQVVGPGTKVARLVGSDQVWIRAAVGLGDLPTLDVPGMNSETGSEVRVLHELDENHRVERRGRVLRLESQLDPQTRMAQVLVVVDNPLDEPDGAVPLLPGSYVQLEITGRPMTDVYELPRSAVRQGDSVWVASSENKLVRRTFQLEWGTEEEVFARGGLQPGDRVVTTPISVPVAGAPVKVQSSATPATAAAGQ